MTRLHRPPFGMHDQRTWEERAGDQRLPYWLRVAALAFGKHRANGHASFSAGQISLILGRVTLPEGEVIPLDKGSTQRAIRKAIEYGWLSPESGSLCLVVPGNAVDGGYGGGPNTPCQKHGRAQEVGAQCSA